MRKDGYRQIVIKTPCKNAVGFYKKCGYHDSAGPYMFKRLDGEGNTELGSPLGVVGVSSVAPTDCRRKRERRRSEREVHRPILYDPSSGNSSGQNVLSKKAEEIKKKQLGNSSKPVSKGNVGASKQRAPVVPKPLRKNSTSRSPLPAKARNKGSTTAGGGRRTSSSRSSRQQQKDNKAVSPAVQQNENVGQGGSETGASMGMCEQQVEKVIESKLRQLLTEIHPNRVQEQHTIHDDQVKLTKENTRMAGITTVQQDGESGTHGHRDNSSEQSAVVVLSDAQLSHLQNYLERRAGTRSVKDHHHHRDSRHGNHHHHHGHPRCSRSMHRRSEGNHAVAIMPTATQQVILKNVFACLLFVICLRYL